MALILLSFQLSRPVNAIMRYEGQGITSVSSDKAFVTANTTIMPPFNAASQFINTIANNSNNFYINYYGIHTSSTFSLVINVPVGSPANISFTIKSCPIKVSISSGTLCADGSAPVTQTITPGQVVTYTSPLTAGAWKNFWIVSNTSVFVSIGASNSSANLTPTTTNS